jgi:hypothetical protein
MTQAPSLDPTQLRALAARVGLWLFEWVLWLAEWLGGRMPKALRLEARQELFQMRRAVGAIVVLLALKKLADVPQPRGASRHHAPHGWRRATPLDSLRTQTRFLSKGRTLRERFAALSRVLDNLDHWIERMAARMKRVPLPAFVMALAPMDVLAALALVSACAVDTS